MPKNNSVFKDTYLIYVEKYNDCDHIEYILTDVYNLWSFQYV